MNKLSDELMEKIRKQIPDSYNASGEKDVDLNGTIYLYAEKLTDDDTKDSLVWIGELDMDTRVMLSKEMGWVDILPDLTSSSEPITQDVLREFGFERIHMNPNWGEGWMRYIKDLGIETSLVVNFGDHYCLEDGVDFIVSFVIGDFVRTEMKLPHIKTVDQLRDLWEVLTGQDLLKGYR